MIHFYMIRRRKGRLARGRGFDLLRNRQGAAAVEFAIIAPVFLLMVLGMLGFGVYLSAAHSVRQLSFDIARATISGVSEAERQTIAASFVETNVDKYAFINVDNLEVAVKDSESAANQSIVEVTYDASHLPIWSFVYIAPMPEKSIRARTAIVNGGYAQ